MQWGLLLAWVCMHTCCYDCNGCAKAACCGVLRCADQAPFRCLLHLAAYLLWCRAVLTSLPPPPPPRQVPAGGEAGHHHAPRRRCVQVGAAALRCTCCPLLGLNVVLISSRAPSRPTASYAGRGFLTNTLLPLPLLRSYAEDEDDMVLDPHLARHLSHWGINMMQVGRLR